MCQIPPIHHSLFTGLGQVVLNILRAEIGRGQRVTLLISYRSVRRQHKGWRMRSYLINRTDIKKTNSLKSLVPTARRYPLAGSAEEAMLQ